jgi:hypothetical protein
VVHLNAWSDTSCTTTRRRQNTSPRTTDHHHHSGPPAHISAMSSTTAWHAVNRAARLRFWLLTIPE